MPALQKNLQLLPAKAKEQKADSMQHKKYSWLLKDLSFLLSRQEEDYAAQASQ